MFLIINIIFARVILQKMKVRIFKPFAYIIGLMVVLLPQGCSKEDETGPSLGGAYRGGVPVKQIDVTAYIPIHPSSLEYFDYSVCFTDNTGEEYRYNIRNTTEESTLRTFHYTSLPVVCRCEVELIPKVPENFVVSFFYFDPKPYLFPEIHFDSHSEPQQVETPYIEDPEVQRIDDMSIAEFLASYGSLSSSTCALSGAYDGINSLFY